MNYAISLSFIISLSTISGLFGASSTPNINASQSSHTCIEEAKIDTSYYSKVVSCFIRILPKIVTILKNENKQALATIDQNQIPQELWLFYGNGNASKINFFQYLDRLHYYLFYKPGRLQSEEFYAPECFLAAFIYMDKLCMSIGSTNIVNPFTIHRLFFVATVLAIKFYCDNFYNNTYYAQVGGIPVEELNELEINFLKTIDFNLDIPREEWIQYSARLGL